MSQNALELRRHIVDCGRQQAFQVMCRPFLFGEGCAAVVHRIIQKGCSLHIDVLDVHRCSLAKSVIVSSVTGAAGRGFETLPSEPRSRAFLTTFEPRTGGQSSATAIPGRSVRSDKVRKSTDVSWVWFRAGDRGPLS